LAKLNITKPEAARRQIDAGVRMLLASEDPVAVATVAAAAFRIVKDLSVHAGGGRANPNLLRDGAPGKDMLKKLHVESGSISRSVAISVARETLAQLRRLA